MLDCIAQSPDSFNAVCAEEVLGLREIATLALKSIPTAMRNRYDYRDPTISNDQLATYLQVMPCPLLLQAFLLRASCVRSPQCTL